jgi:hypothetical protein
MKRRPMGIGFVRTLRNPAIPLPLVSMTPPPMQRRHRMKVAADSLLSFLTH